MSVLIKGMQIPKNCSDCPLNYDMMACIVTGTCFWSDTLMDFDCQESRLYDCPLVEIPKTHGRLVDADKLMAIFSDRLERVVGRYGIDSSEAGILSGAMQLLESQMAIIEAEGV